ncbi:hypothetical protein BH09ACT1_BH09ACT1_06820 [soil metagenome]
MPADDFTPSDDVIALSTGFGLGLRKIRIKEGLTLDRVATAATSMGLKWSTARVVEFEKGKIPASLSTLMVLGTVLTALVGRGFALSELLGWDRWLELPGGLIIHSDAVRQALSGGQTDLRPRTSGAPERHEITYSASPVNSPLEALTAEQLFQLRRTAGLADQRAAKRLGMELDEFLAFAFPVLGASLSAYRDSRLPAGASAQERGQFSRRAVALVKEFAARYVAGDPETLEKSALAISGSGQLGRTYPLADQDPWIRKRASAVPPVKHVQKMLTVGHVPIGGHITSGGITVSGIPIGGPEQLEEDQISRAAGPAFGSEGANHG